MERHLATATSLMTAARHEGVRRRLMVSAGRSALLAGWLAFDRGDIASAHRLWDASIGTAEGTLDAAVLAASLTCQSYAAARRGDPGSAWQLAHSASEHTSDDSRAMAWVTARIALYAAQLGEQDTARSAMKRSLEIGESLPSPRPGHGDTPWMRFFDLSRLLSSTAHTAALLKDPDAADYAGPGRGRAWSGEGQGPRGVVLAEAALTAAHVGELDLCLDHGSAAANLTRDMEVSIAADLLYEVVAVILPYSDTRAVRELLPQLTRLTRTADRESEVEQDQGARHAVAGSPMSDRSAVSYQTLVQNASLGIPQSEEDQCTD